jgi:hypothetical protein
MAPKRRAAAVTSESTGAVAINGCHSWSLGLTVSLVPHATIRGIERASLGAAVHY